MADPIQYEDKDDKWFDWKGAKKPERTPHGLKDEEITQRLKENLEGHVCEWVHNGGEIYCVAGGFRHGRRIGPKQTIKDGKLVKLQPIYRK